MIVRLTVLLLIFYSTAALGKSPSVYNTSDTLEKDTIAPEFPGGTALFYEYLKTSIKYPLASRLNGVQGKVNLKFVIDSTGQVSKVKIKRGLDRYCDRQALRIMRRSPKWIPGSIKGKRVGFSYDIPISFVDTVALKGAAVLVNGNLLRKTRDRKRFNLDSLPYRTIDSDFAKAIFGDNYNKNLLVFNDSTLNLNGYSASHFKNTFKMFQNIDTAKVQLNVAEKPVSLSTWRQYLNKDSILNIAVYPSNVFRTQDKNKLGTVTLITKAGIDKQKKIRQDLIQSIVAYREGTSLLRNELVVIDDYTYNSEAIFKNVDTNIIQTVNILSPVEAVKLFGDAYKNGIIYIYTKRFRTDRLINDKQKLFTLIAKYKQEHSVPVDQAFSLNNIFLDDFNKISELPASEIQYVNIISAEEARSFFGNQEQRGIIYVVTKPKSSK